MVQWRRWSRRSCLGDLAQAGAVLNINFGIPIAFVLVKSALETKASTEPSLERQGFELKIGLLSEAVLVLVT